MTSEWQPGLRSKIALAIRVRGMSNDNKFFDEMTETCYISPSGLITRLPNRVELDSEIHVINKATRRGGNFRVVWVNVQGREGWHDVGLELIDMEGDMWGRSLGKARAGEAGTVAEAVLQCQRCQASALTLVPEAAGEFIVDGFTISRPCERCKASTPWAFTPGAAAPQDRSRAAGGGDQRRKGRIPMKMKIMVIRDREGTSLEDICETVNVSANGAYFLTKHRYAQGEWLKVIAPYREGAVAIPVRARVVRLDEPKDSYLHAVAVELNREELRGRTLRGD